MEPIQSLPQPGLDWGRFTHIMHGLLHMNASLLLIARYCSLTNSTLTCKYYYFVSPLLNYSNFSYFSFFDKFRLHQDCSHCMRNWVTLTWNHGIFKMCRNTTMFWEYIFVSFSVLTYCLTVMYYWSPCIYFNRSPTGISITKVLSKILADKSDGKVNKTPR